MPCASGFQPKEAEGGGEVGGEGLESGSNHEGALLEREGWGVVVGER